MQGQGSGANFHAGLNVLNASQALAFVRQRHNLNGLDGDLSDSGDFARTHRQQAFIASVEYKLKQEGIFGDLGKMQSLLDVVKKDVVLDNQWNVLDFAQQAPQLTGGHLTFNTLPIQNYAMRNGEQVNLVDPAQLAGIVQKIFAASDASASAPAPSSSAPASRPAAAAPSSAAAQAVVDVFNGSGVTGAAASELKALTAAGYTAGTAGNHAARPRTEVLYGTGAATAAAQIAARLYVSGTTPSSSVTPGHVMVVLGADFAPSSASAAGTPAAPSAPVSIPAQGPAVEAGGIPCVE
jgi:hypothetical protein